jgi:hypothetical protein
MTPPTCDAKPRPPLVYIAWTMAIVGVVFWLPVLGGPDLLGPAKSIIFAALLVVWFGSEMRRRGHDRAQRAVLRIGLACALVVLLGGVVDLLA